MRDISPRRFGALVPPGNVAVERETPYFLPGDVQMHISRLWRPPATQPTLESLGGLLDSAEPSAATLVQLQPEVIVFYCTSASFIRGVGEDLKLAERISAATGIPVITTSTAVVRALQRLEAKKVFVLTPYQQNLNDLETQFLAGNGFETSLQSFFYEDFRQIRTTTPVGIIEKLRQHAAEIEEADSIFISCTNLHCLEAVEAIEAEFARPVVTSNQASLWAVMEHMGLKALHGGGSLLDGAAR